MTDEKEDDVCEACGAGFNSAEELQEAINDKKESSDKEDDKYDERVDLKVYDMPVELKNKYISKAKLDYDNQLWKVLEEGMDKMLEERESKVPQLEARVKNLEEQIAYLKVKLEEQNSEDISKDEGAPATFGGGRSDDLEESDEELLDKFDKQ